MGEKDSVPAIRFAGFADDWERRKLGAVVKEITRSDPESDAPVMMITANNGFIEQSERYAFDNAGESLKKYILLKKGELAYNHGASKLRPYGSCFALTNAENARIPFVYHCFSAAGNNSEFLSIELNGKDVENQLRQIVSSGARMDGLLNISFNEYASISVLLPELHEQNRIADFFRHLDHLITLHRRKYIRLCNIKKSMLEKMFPREGTAVPEIRFAGFTGDWKRRKLGELVEIKDSARIPNAEWSDSGVPYIRASDITNEDIHGVLFIPLERYEFYKNKTGVPTMGDVLFNGGGEIGKTLLKVDDKPIYVQGGAVLYARTSVSKTLIGQYLKTYFETGQVKSYIDAASVGGTMKHFTLKPSQEMSVIVPTIEEQKQIGTYFLHLDHLITLYQRRLERLQNIKKACLEKMFV